MKMKSLMTALIVVFAAGSAMADLVLSARLVSGFVQPQNRFSIQCEVYTDHVGIVRQMANNPPENVYFKYQLPEGTDQLLKAVSTATITSTPAPTDIGLAIYSAYVPVSLGKVLMVDLGSTRDSATITRNQSPAAQTLKELLNTLCRRSN